MTYDFHNFSCLAAATVSEPRSRGLLDKMVASWLPLLTLTTIGKMVAARGRAGTWRPRLVAAWGTASAAKKRHTARAALSPD